MSMSMSTRRSSRLLLALAAVLSLAPSNAFAPGHGGLSSTRASPLFAEDAPPPAPSPLATKTIVEGSHDELMYALGVNLARQLGDVRPLVTNGDELTQLARGLLDAVTGRCDDEDQRALLGRRGEDLNKIVVERA